MMQVSPQTGQQGLKSLTTRIVERDEGMRLSYSLVNVILDNELAMSKRKDYKIAQARALVEEMGCSRIEECFSGVSSGIPTIR